MLLALLASCTPKPADDASTDDTTPPAGACPEVLVSPEAVEWTGVPMGDGDTELIPYTVSYGSYQGAFEVVEP